MAISAPFSDRLASDKSKESLVSEAYGSGWVSTWFHTASVLVHWTGSYRPMPEGGDENMT
jgi:hypothetical protein